MKKQFIPLSCAVVLGFILSSVFAPAALFGQSAPSEKNVEEPDNAPIVKLQLFKNGFGFVTREIAPRDWKDPLVLKPAITPRHGTLWFEPAETVIRRTTRERTVVETAAAKKNDAPGYQPNWANLTDAFAWQLVTVKTKDGIKHTGTVIGNQPPQEPDKANQPTYEIIDSLSAYRSSSSTRISRPESSYAIPVKSQFGQVFITLKTDDGYLTIRQEDVVAVKAEKFADEKGANPANAKKTKTTEEVQVVEAPKNHLGAVRMRYLSQDITWSPFYRVNLKDDGKLMIDASATVMNNLEDFEDAEIEFISGFPNMVFASSLSALSKGMSFQSFLNNLANPNEPSYLRSSAGRSGVMSQSVMSNSAVYYDMDDEEEYPQKPSLWTASGMDDMQYKSAGKLTMRKGDVLQLPIASAPAEYELITTWTAPMEKRFSFGEASGDTTLWNCVRFRNPFDFALTSAPYEIEQDGNVLGQSTGTWFGADQPATVKITKSMAVTATMTQTESGSLNRYYTEKKWDNNYKYHYPDVTAQIVLTNHGTKPVKVVFDSVFYGELIEAEGDPKKTQLLADNRTRNQKNKLTWEVTVPASGKTTLNYTYKIILDN